MRRRLSRSIEREREQREQRELVMVPGVAWPPGL